jgi:hypothetical protein
MISRTLGQTFQYTSAEDDALYERAKAKGMDKVVEYYENGGKRSRMSGAKQMIYKRAANKVRRLMDKYPNDIVANHFNTYTPLLYRLCNGDYHKVNINDAERINANDTSIDYDLTDKQPTQAQWEQAQKIVRRMATDMPMATVANKLDVQYKKIWRICKDKYKNPNPVAFKILEYEL